MRDLKTIAAELRLIAAVRASVAICGQPASGRPMNCCGEHVAAINRLDPFGDGG